MVYSSLKFLQFYKCLKQIKNPEMASLNLPHYPKSEKIGSIERSARKAE